MSSLVLFETQSASLVWGTKQTIDIYSDFVISDCWRWSALYFLRPAFLLFTLLSVQCYCFLSAIGGVNHRKTVAANS